MDWLVEIVVTIIPDFLGSVIEVIVTAIPDFFGDSIEVTVTAIPEGFGLATIFFAAAGFFLLMMGMESTS